MSDKAFFRNGLGGTRIEAKVRLVDQGLDIRDPADGLLLALWAYGDLTPIEPSPKRLRLTCRTDPDAWLSLGDPAVIERLNQLAPALAPRRRRRLSWGILGMAAAPFLLGAVLIYALPSRGTRPLGSLVGEVCTGPAGQAALDSLTRRLVEAGELTTPISVQVVRSPIVNAFALPAGRVLLFDGLLQETESPDEVAAILAHLFSHLALDPMAQQNVSREAETEADAMGLGILQKADISVLGMGNFFRRLEAREAKSGALPVFLSDHPASASRAQIQVIQPFTRPALTPQEWQALRDICG